MRATFCSIIHHHFQILARVLIILSQVYEHIPGNRVELVTAGDFQLICVFLAILLRSLLSSGTLFHHRQWYHISSACSIPKLREDIEKASLIGTRPVAWELKQGGTTLSSCTIELLAPKVAACQCSSSFILGY